MRRDPRTKLLRLPVRLAVTAVVVCCASVVIAQSPGNEGLDQSRAHGAAALQHLRDNMIDRALDSLGAAADLSLPVTPNEDDGLSAAAGALHRALMQLDAEEQFQLLYKWSMPTDTRKGVRLLTTLVPQVAPPKAFARVLGERPRDESFPVSTIGSVRGLFSSAWSLVRAADEIGRLRRLTTELEQLTEDNVPNSDVLLLLARMANNRDNASGLKESLETRLSIMQAVKSKPGAQTAEVIDPSDIVLAAAALTREELRPLSVRMFNELVELTYDRPAWRLRPFLRVAHATGVQLSQGASRPEAVHNSRLKHWVSTSGRTSALHAMGAVDAVWLMHEDHILHLAGARNDVLFLRYPLTGDFEFTCETQEGGRIETDGGLVYGGLQFEARGATNQLRIWDADIAHFVQKPCPFVRHENRPTFNRVSIRSNDKGATFLANRHPVWRDDTAANQSPWLGLRSFDERRPMFRNLKIIGNPVIPREVRMTDGNHLRGWQSHFFGETQAAFAEGSPVSPQSPSVDWSVKSGIISSGERKPTQGFLRYQRPLLDGESITYEFHFEQGEFEVHPALGRIAFLMERGGVRVRWITDGTREWTGLPANNALVEALNRRGPRQLPLKQNDWNTVTLARRAGKVAVSLNDTMIFARTIDFAGDHLFGFYLDRKTSRARIRNVVMTGNWPEALPDKFVRNPSVVAGDSPSTADVRNARSQDQPSMIAERRALNAIFNDQQIAAAALAVHRRAAKMPLKERYEFLCEWVLPSVDHETIRVAFDFTPTHPPPPVRGEDRIDTDRLRVAELSGQSRVQIGGQLVAPAIDLVEAATELSRLEEVRDRVARTTPANDQQRRSRLAMLVLVDIARKDFDSALDNLDQLFPLVQDNQSFEMAERWPETLAFWAAVQHHETHEAVREMIYQIVFRHVRRLTRESNEVWPHQMMALMGWSERIDLITDEPNASDAPVARFGLAPALKQWSPASRVTARSRGIGFPPFHWQLTSEGIQNLCGHGDNYLYFQSPLRGDYEVEFDATPPGWRDLHLSVAGTWVSPFYTRTSYRIGGLRGERPRGKIEPRLMEPGVSRRLRTVVRNGACATYVNGRKIHEESIPEDHVPWLAIRSFLRHNGTARNLRITGEPVIPASVRLTALEDLAGWMPYFAEAIGDRRSDWRQLGDLSNGGGIVGEHKSDLAGSACESLLYYHRPMLEDGEIEYEFYYRDGTSHTHPALDRLAFMLEPNGVRVHWITDGPYDRTGLDPTNLFDEPNNRRGPDTLPLKLDDWNRLRLSLKGDTIQLNLNNQLVYQRQLERTNQRTFGVFHYADRTEARVRNVVWRGDWPRELPPIVEQELAGKGTEFLDDSLPELTAVFEHDFVSDGFPLKRFTVRESGWLESIVEEPDGVHVTRPGGDGYLSYSIAPRCTVQGDFDITVSFEQFRSAPAAETKDTRCSLLLSAILNDDVKTQIYLFRRHLRANQADRQLVQGAYRQVVGGEMGIAYFGNSVFEADAGTLRVARRGKKMYFLVAENDSSNFQLLGEETLSGADLRLGDLRILTQTFGPGSTKVVLKRMTIRATSIVDLPADDAKKVIAELDAQRDTLPQRFVHDFTKDAATEELFHQWLLPDSLKHDADGLRMVAPGSDDWTFVGLAPQFEVRGDFDIAVSLGEVKLGRPKTGEKSSFYLQLEFADQQKTQASVIYSRQPDGSREAYSQNRIGGGDGKLTYLRLHAVPVDAIDRIRLTRRGRRLSYLFRRPGSDDYELLQQADIGPEPIPKTCIRLMLHTGGAGIESEVVLKHFRVGAERINPLNQPVSLR